MRKFEDFQPSRDQQFVSAGNLCGLMQILPGQLGVLMEDRRIRFGMILDGVGYLTVDDAEIIGERLKEIRQELTDAVDKLDRAGGN
jgi:hypothetical protein